MKIDNPENGKNKYPGELAQPDDIHLLADEYKKAAQAVLLLAKKGKPLTRAPYRLMAIHAIELYLNVFLLRSGIDSTTIRGLRHDLKARAKLAAEKGLMLRKRTQKHLESLTENREYLVSRYGPEMSSTMSQLNRLSATLEEVAKKATLNKQHQ